MSKSIEELNDLIREWAKARKLDTADPARQFLKVMEEFGKELSLEIVNYDPMFSDMAIDAVGDTHVTLIVLALQINTTPIIEGGGDIIDTPEQIIHAMTHSAGQIAEDLAKSKDASASIGYMIWLNKQISERVLLMDYSDCVQVAYNEIKDRKGEMRNGVFIKEEDL